MQTTMSCKMLKYVQEYVEGIAGVPSMFSQSVMIMQMYVSFVEQVHKYIEIK